MVIPSVANRQIQVSPAPAKRGHAKTLQPVLRCILMAFYSRKRH